MTEEPNISRTNWLLENENLVNDLKKSRLLKNVSEQFFMELIIISEVVNYPSESVIVREGQFNKYLYFILQGKISLYTGGELILEMGRIGDIIGEINTINDPVFFLSAVSKAPLVLLRLDLNKLQDQDNKISKDFLSTCNEIITLSLIDKIRILVQRSRNFSIIQNQLNETRNLLVNLKDVTNNKDDLTADELFTTLPDLLIHLDQEGNIRQIKPGSNSNLQFESQPYIGKNFTEIDILPKHIKELGMNTLINAMENQQGQQVRFKLEILNISMDLEARVIVTGKQEIIILIRDYSA